MVGPAWRPRALLQVLFKYCAEEVAQARHTALFQRFIKASPVQHARAGSQRARLQRASGAGQAWLRLLHPARSIH